MATLNWQREGDEWLLTYGGRRMARIVPDTRIKGGWRILHGHNDLGPRQTLSAAKHQAMHEAECDLSWERHKRRGENEQRI